MTPKITMIDNPTPAMRKAIAGPLVRFNETQTGHSDGYRFLTILISDADTEQVVGGLWGSTSFYQLQIDLVFVPEELRRSGLGRRLMTDAEIEASRRGCLGVWLDTFSFQARGFYERLGYTVFGTIENYPPGHSRFFLKKSLKTEGDQT